MAKSGAYTPQDLSVFYGFASSRFLPVHVSLDAMATLVAWQCLCLNGSVDQHALNEIGSCRTKFRIVE